MPLRRGKGCAGIPHGPRQSHRRAGRPIPAAGPDDVAVTAQGLSFVAGMARRSVPGFNLRESIRNFAGVRAISDRDDFIVEEAPGCPGFINLSGIKSPGLTSAPALAKEAVALLRKSGLVLQEREGFRLHPRPRPFRYAGARDRAAMAAENPRMGRVICRCETVTEGEIVEAIHAPVPARSIDGVKRRVGSGMGRCPGGLLQPPHRGHFGAGAEHSPDCCAAGRGRDRNTHGGAGT